MLSISHRRFYRSIACIMFVTVLASCSPKTTDTLPTQTGTKAAPEGVENPDGTQAVKLPQTPTPASASAQATLSQTSAGNEPIITVTPPGDLSGASGTGTSPYPGPISTGQVTPNGEQDFQDPIPYPPIVDIFAATPIPTQLTLSVAPTQTLSVTATSTPEILILTKLTATDPSSVNLASGQTQLIEFFAYWDPLSKSMAPVLHKLAVIYQNRIKFVFLDIDDPENETIQKALGYENPPQIFLVDGGGNIIDQWRGYVGEDELVSAFTIVP
jgi:thiol-disulfide isomerase/thioredoxin